MNKKRVLVVIGLILAISIPVLGKDKSTESMIVNGKEIQITTQVNNGRKLVPLRDMCQLLDIEIVGFQDNNIFLKKEDNHVKIIVGSPLIINDSGYFKSDVNALISEGKTYVPVRAIAYMFGYDLKIKNKKLLISQTANWSVPKADYASALYMADSPVALLIMDIVALSENYLIDSAQMPIASIAKERAEELFHLRQEVERQAGDLKTITAQELSKHAQNLLADDYKNLIHISRYEYELVEVNQNYLSNYYEKSMEFLDNTMKYAVPIY